MVYPHNGTLYSNKKEPFTDTHMDESYNRSEDILYVSIYMKFKNRQMKSIWTVATIIVILGREEKGAHCKSGNIPYLDLGGDYTSVKIHRTVCLGFAHFTKYVIPQKALKNEQWLGLGRLQR